MLKPVHPSIEPKFSRAYMDWEYPFLPLKGLPSLVGLTGPTKCGKTIMAERLVTTFDFQFLSISKIVFDVTANLGLEIEGWRTLGNMARDYRNLKGKEIFARLGMERIRKMLLDHDKVVIDGILHPSELEYFLGFNGFVIIGIDSNIDTRAEAAKSWYGGDDLEEVKEDIKERDRFEQYSLDRSDPLAPNVSKCLELAGKMDEIIHVREFNKKTLYDQIDRRMAKLQSRFV
jgi:dephospho-CoA kinase